jgi:hypothetical protein
MGSVGAFLLGIFRGILRIFMGFISWDWDIWGFIIGIKCEILMILMGFCEIPSGK